MIKITFEVDWSWFIKHIRVVWLYCVQCVGQIRRKPARALVAALIAVGMGIWLGPRAGMLWLLFLLFLVYEWENRIIGVLVLISLASCPFLLSFHQDAFAETMAVYAYFFLVMTVTLQIVEFKRHPEKFKDDDDEIDGINSTH